MASGAPWHPKPAPAVQPKQWLSHMMGAPVSSPSEAMSNTVKGPGARVGSLYVQTTLQPTDVVRSMSAMEPCLSVEAWSPNTFIAGSVKHVSNGRTQGACSWKPSSLPLENLAPCNQTRPYDRPLSHLGSNRPASKQVYTPGTPQAERELLVEVAVVQAAVPAHADRVAAHHALGRGRVEAVHQQLHAVASEGQVLP